MQLVVRGIILVAGKGTRFGGLLPKQFEDLGGVPVYHWCAEALAGLPGMAELVIVTPPGGIPSQFRRNLSRLKLPVSLVQGGARRQDSVAAGLRALQGHPCQVAVVHDGARPFPPADATIKLTRAAMKTGGALLAVRVTDTVKRESGGVVAQTIDRSQLWHAQTPQAIRADHIPAVLDLLQSQREYTDESSVLEALGVAPAIVEGRPSNFKITHSEDLLRARAVVSARTAETHA